MSLPDASAVYRGERYNVVALSYASRTRKLQTVAVCECLTQIKCKVMQQVNYQHELADEVSADSSGLRSAFNHDTKRS